MPAKKKRVEVIEDVEDSNSSSSTYNRPSTSGFSKGRVEVEDYDDSNSSVNVPTTSGFSKGKRRVEVEDDDEDDDNDNDEDDDDNNESASSKSFEQNDTADRRSTRKTRNSRPETEEDECDEPSPSDSEIEVPDHEEVNRKMKDDVLKVGARRQLRSGYRRLINELNQMGIGQDEEGNPTLDIKSDHSAKLKSAISKMNKLFDQVTHPREAALDSNMYKLITSWTGQKILSLNSDVISFVPDEFAEKLITFLVEDREACPHGLSNQAWVELGRRNSHMFRTAPTLHTFSGTFDPEAVPPKEKPKRRPRAKAVENTTERPTIIQQIQHNDRLYDEKTTENVEHVYHTLLNLYKTNQDEPLCYFRFVIDPLSFSRTIENIFHTSFLVKDGNAKISYDEYELPVIMPIPDKTTGGGGSDRYALALGMSVSEWNELKYSFKITQAAIQRK